MFRIYITVNIFVIIIVIPHMKFPAPIKEKIRILEYAARACFI